MDSKMLVAFIRLSGLPPDIKRQLVEVAYVATETDKKTIYRNVREYNKNLARITGRELSFSK